MQIIFFLTIILLLLSISLSLKDDDIRHKIEAGKKQLEILIANNNTDTLCWKKNIMTLMNQQCTSLSYNSRSNTALKLTICHLKQLGIDIKDTECTSDYKKCIQQQIMVNNAAFSTYNQFFTHIDNICIYVQMTENDKNMKKSIHNLFAATIQSADYLVETHQKQNIFQKEILNKQTKIKEANDEIIGFHEQHRKNINHLESIASNIQYQQNDILDKQIQFQNMQKEFHETITNIDIKQENIVQNQQKIEDNLDILHEKHLTINDNIASSISLQQESINKQQNIYEMQNKFGIKMKQSNDKIDSFFQQSSEKQNNILNKQDNTLNAMETIQYKTNELNIEIKNAKKEIEELTKESHNAYQQIMSMIDEVLFVANSIYKMDITILQQFISIQSVAFYFFWCIISYIVTIPKSGRSSRILLFAGVIISFTLEKSIISVTPMMIRQSMFSLNVALFMWFVLTYKDPQQTQMQLLRSIKTFIIRNNALKSQFKPTNLR